MRWEDLKDIDIKAIYSTEEAEDALAFMDDTMAQIEGQLAAAKEIGDIRGELENPAWFKSAHVALKHAKLNRARLVERMTKLKKLTSESDPVFAFAFVRAAEIDLPTERFDDLKLRAQALLNRKRRG